MQEHGRVNRGALQGRVVSIDCGAGGLVGTLLRNWCVNTNREERDARLPLPSPFLPPFLPPTPTPTTIPTPISTAIPTLTPTPISTST